MWLKRHQSALVRNKLSKHVLRTPATHLDFKGSTIVIRRQNSKKAMQFF
jgi:hypothetical protein